MTMQTFKAPTMVEALTQVKIAIGVDAIILHTRTIQMRQWWGLRRREMVEITAGKGMNVGSRNLKRPAQQSTSGTNGSASGIYNRNGAAPRNAVEGSRQL